MQPLRRWQRWSEAVALALGVNIWLSLILIPALHVRALESPAQVVAAIAPLLPLGYGVWRGSELWLLGVVPSALLMPISLTPAIAAASQYGPLRLAAVATGLIAYLLGASLFAGRPDPVPPMNLRPLAALPAPRWRRRERVYRQMVLLAIAMPISGLYWVNFDPAIAGFLAQMYPGREASMRTLLNIAVLVAWLILYSRVFVGALSAHRTGDRELFRAFERARGSAARGRPRRRFHLAVATALAFMAILVYLRHL